jgi:hypothetical protein
MHAANLPFFVRAGDEIAKMLENRRPAGVQGVNNVKHDVMLVLLISQSPNTKGQYEEVCIAILVRVHVRVPDDPIDILLP